MSNCNLLRQKVRQKGWVIPENWHFNLRFVLKTTKTPMFVFIRGRSQTTFTRRGRYVVQKCPLFVNVHTIENVNGGR